MVSNWQNSIGQCWLRSTDSCSIGPVDDLPSSSDPPGPPLLSSAPDKQMELSRRVLITGGFGFIGRHLVRAVIAAGHRCLVVDLGVRPDDTSDSVSSIQCSLDALNWDAVGHHLGGSPDVLVHLAAIGVNPAHANWQDCFHWNVDVALKLWIDVAATGCRRIVTCGSCFEYGASAERYHSIPTDAPLAPMGPYAASKAAATMALHGLSASANLEGLVLRPCVVFGEGEAPTRLWPSLRRAALAGEDFPMTSGRQVRDFVAVEVVAKAFSDAVGRRDLVAGRTLIENIGSGVEESVIEFAARWWQHWGATGRLLPGQLPDRANEAMRFVPKV